MATNTYFTKGYKPEQNLYEDIIIESIKIYGQDCYYLPREIVSLDTILNEDIESSFSTAYTVEMYIESVEGFEGEGTIFQKFGLELRDSITLIMAKRRWDKAVGIYNNQINSIRPMEGDLIYLPLTRNLFEIKFVEHEQPFYQLNNLPIYKMQCEMFEYNNEKIDTGILPIDEYETQLAQQINLTLDSTTINFDIQEKVFQDIGTDIIRAEVVRDEDDKLIVTQVRSDNGTTTEFQVTNIGNGIGNIQDDASPANSYAILAVADSLENDSIAQNDDLQTEADSIIDFSEDNPFGEP